MGRLADVISVIAIMIISTVWIRVRDIGHRSCYLRMLGQWHDLKLGTIWINLIDFLALKASIIFVQQESEGDNDSESSETYYDGRPRLKSIIPTFFLLPNWFNWLRSNGNFDFIYQWWHACCNASIAIATDASVSSEAGVITARHIRAPGLNLILIVPINFIP